MNPNEVMLSVSKGRGLWKPNQDKIELRRPQSTCTGGGEECSDSNKSDPSSIAARSTLSVEAKEFIPRSVDLSSSSMSSSEHSNPSSSEQHLKNLTSYLSDVMCSITSCPGQFDQLVNPLLEELSSSLGDEEVVQELVTSIIEQAVTERNFRYNGARLCRAFNHCFEPGEDSVFRKVLLTKISAIYENIEDLLKLDPCRVYGYVHFLGELFIQVDLTKGSGIHIAVLGSALLDALKLLMNRPNCTSTKLVCDVLKLAGMTLDVDKHEEMDSFFSDLTHAVENPALGPDMKALIQSVLELRKKNWGLSSNAEVQLSHSSFSKPNTSRLPDEVVMYGPDGNELTPEEKKFLNESTEAPSSDLSGDDLEVWDLGDDVNAEVMAAFVDFLNDKPRS